MRRCRDWKLVVYLDDEDGELYDLRKDPGETDNLWNNPANRQMRDRNDRPNLAVVGGWFAERQSPTHPHAAEADAHLTAAASTP